MAKPGQTAHRGFHRSVPDYVIPAVPLRSYKKIALRAVLLDRASHRRKHVVGISCPRENLARSGYRLPGPTLPAGICLEHFGFRKAQQAFDAVRPVAKQIICVSTDEIGWFHSECKLEAT